jgi:hypothetical protein
MAIKYLKGDKVEPQVKVDLLVVRWERPYKILSFCWRVKYW